MTNSPEYSRQYYLANQARIRAAQTSRRRSAGVMPRVATFEWNRQRAQWLFLAAQVPGCLEPKKCKGCQRYFGPDDFQKAARRCRPCDRAHKRASKLRNPEKAKARRKAAKHRRRARLAGSGGSHTEAEWQSVLSSWRHRCARCDAGENLTRDHVIPLSKGGSNDWTNLQPLCHLCNSTKCNVLTGIVLA